MKKTYNKDKNKQENILKQGRKIEVRVFNIFRKKKDKNKDIMHLCDGIHIDEQIYEMKENRIWTLLLKGLMVYFTVAGAVLGYVSASGIKYNGIFINLVLLIFSLYMSCIYYNKKSENIGNIGILMVILALGMGESLYINSGFYSVLNDINVYAKEFFGFSGIRTYTEPINDRYMAVNLGMTFIGMMFVLLYNMWILKRMMYLDTLLAGTLVCMIPVYVQREPDLIYVIMLVVGAMLGFVFKRGGIVDKIDSDSKYKVEDGKIHNVYEIRAYASIGASIFIVAVVVALVLQVVVPKKDYYDEEADVDITRVSSTKEKNMESVGNFWQSGLTGVLNKYNHTGGMNSGRLGGVSSVNLDYNTDFVLKIAPYSYDTVYLKQFVYGDYVPYRNFWSGRDVHQIREESKNIEEEKNYGKLLKKSYEKKDEYSSKAILEIENVSLGWLRLEPYYTEAGKGVAIELNNELSIEYYPKHEENNTKVEETIDKSQWIRYPVTNSRLLRAFTINAGLEENMDPDIMVAKIAAYFQENMPYTLNPGALGKGKDFVNDFLENKKKGYCAHFATTATLALRYMGVPARYVEGYAVSYENMLNNSLMDITKKYSDYYDGHSELGETAVLDVKVSDANAHAWVEIYDDEYGWKPVEVTPASSEEERSEFWSRFMNIFRESGEGDGEDRIGEERTRENKDIFTSDIMVFFVYILIVVGVIVSVIYVVKLILYKMRYYKASLNDKLIMEYSKYLKKKRRKYVELKEKMNYKDQIEWLQTNEVIKTEGDTDKIIEILDKAGFSNKVIDEYEFKYIKEYIN